MLFLRRFGSTREGGSLKCPACQSTKVKYIETLGLQMEQWRCKACGQMFRYQREALPQDMPAADLRKRPELVIGTGGPTFNSSQTQLLKKLATKGV